MLNIPGTLFEWCLACLQRDAAGLKDKKDKSYKLQTEGEEETVDVMFDIDLTVPKGRYTQPVFKNVF